MITLDTKTVFVYGGILVLSILTTILGNAQTGLIVLVGTTLISQLWALEQRGKHRHRRLEEQLATAKSEFVSKVGLPLVATYFRLVEESCPLFRLAAGNIYDGALNSLTSLSKGEIRAYQLNEVFHYLEFLFRDFHAITKIKAISSGEFDEWKEHESWWSRQYFGLHEAAFNRGAELERIFVVHSKQQEKSVDEIFQRNVQYHVRVKVALKSKISAADSQAANCLLFYDEHDEPLYALVAYHDSEGKFQRAVIYGDRQNVRRITEMYNRIDGVARSYGVRIAA